MRRFLAILCVVLVGGGVYAASAFRAAWEIREAVHSGDTATLERRVDWPAVRSSLKQSAAEARAIISELSQGAAEALPRPSLWQRIKGAATAWVADPLIERYVTAEGAPRLWSLRETWRKRIRPVVLAEPQSALAGTWLADTSLDKALSMARRVDKVAFTSPLRMEFEIRDRIVEDRRWRAVLELRGQAWMLTQVHVQRGATSNSGQARLAGVLTR